MVTALRRRAQKCRGNPDASLTSRRPRPISLTFKPTICPVYTSPTEAGRPCAARTVVPSPRRWRGAAPSAAFHSYPRPASAAVMGWSRSTPCDRIRRGKMIPCGSSARRGASHPGRRPTPGREKCGAGGGVFRRLAEAVEVVCRVAARLDVCRGAAPTRPDDRVHGLGMVGGGDALPRPGLKELSQRGTQRFAPEREAGRSRQRGCGTLVFGTGLATGRTRCAGRPPGLGRIPVSGQSLPGVSPGSPPAPDDAPSPRPGHRGTVTNTFRPASSAPTGRSRCSPPLASNTTSG